MASLHQRLERVESHIGRIHVGEYVKCPEHVNTLLCSVCDVPAELRRKAEQQGIWPAFQRVMRVVAGARQLRCVTPRCQGTLYCFMHDNRMVGSLLDRASSTLLEEACFKRPMPADERRKILEVLGEWLYRNWSGREGSGLRRMRV